MSGAIATTIATAVIGSVVQQAFAPKAPSAPSAPSAPTMPQANKAPDEQARRASAQAAGAAPGMGGGAPSTMLTGPGGVAPGALNLGKNTLLGG